MSRLGIYILSITLTLLAACHRERAEFGIAFDQACDMASSYDYAGELRSFTFNATTAWSVTAEEDESEDGSVWLRVEPSSGGPGFGQFNIIVSENSSSEERYGRVVVRSGGESRSIEVVQKRRPIFEREACEVYTARAEGGDIAIAVATNKEYWVSIATTEGWLTSVVEATRALQEERITFTATPNVSSLTRVAMVSIVSEDGEILDAFSIVQAAEGSATNEITYRTSTSTTANIQHIEEYGTVLRAHFYDAERQCCRVVFDGAVRHIPTGAFAHCEEITEIVLPCAVTSFGSALFEGCSGRLVAECSIASSDVTASEPQHWLYGSAFSHVVLGANVGKRAFGGYAMQSVAFGEGVDAVAADAFTGCAELKEVVATSVAEWCSINFANAEANPLSRGDVALIIDGQMLTELDITTEVEVVGPYAFYNYAALERIALGDSVRAIRQGAFALCDVEEVVLGRGIESIGREALHQCRCQYLIVGFNLPDFNASATSTTHWLYGIEAENITIGAEVTTLGSLALSGIATLRSVAVSDSVTHIGQGAFAENHSLESISLGTGIERISEHTLYNCTALVELSLPSRVTTIEEYALQGCSALKRLYIGAEVRHIGDYALQGCCAMEELHITATTPPTLGAYALDTRSTTLVIYVPASALEAYSSAEGWREAMNNE